MSNNGLSTKMIVFLLGLALVAILSITYGSQYFIDSEIVVSTEKLADKKTEYEISKIEAEISRIRSDTAGSLFWLKLIALFVTVGGAVGGYLVGQSRATVAKLKFENRKNVDEVYQSILQELSDDSAILRASAAVKLGSILQSFPAEWNVGEPRKQQIRQLTKQVLAAALSIENDQKVLKTLTISIVLHKVESDAQFADVKGLDLSGSKASDAYWARCNFEYADFYAADLSRASFRKSDLSGAQFREADLTDAVFAESICSNTNFKMADLRGASFDNASLEAVNFEKARVHGVSIRDAAIGNIPDCLVDISADGEAECLVPVSKWLGLSQKL